jgi:hypothetical protein
MLKGEGKACPGPRSGITYIEDTCKVLYRSATTHGSSPKNFEVFSGEEFIAPSLSIFLRS